MSIPTLEERSEVTGLGSENCLPIGARVAEFEITGIVGEGGFGIVYLAMDHSLQRIVALKEYMPGVMAGRGNDQSVVVRSKRHQEAFDTGLRSFINEARLLAQFDHPALIKIHRFWEQNNTGYMAMRYYEGQTLKRIVQDNPGVVKEAWLKVIVQSILEALEALYKVQILHRDISPENIMIQKNGEAVLLDFGAARQIISDMTQALTVILKPGYAPIEQYADDPSMLQGPWTDIYSLSAVMYVAVTNRTPPSSVARMIQDPIEALTKEQYPEFSEKFLSAINQGMAVKPEHRPRTIAEFRALIGLDADATLLAPRAAPKAAKAASPRAAAAKPAPSTATSNDITDASLTRHLPRPAPPARSGASTLEATTRPMSQAAPAPASTPTNDASAEKTIVSTPANEQGGGTVQNGVQPVVQGGAGKAGRSSRSVVRTAALAAVILVAGVVTWRTTHQAPAVASAAALPTAGTAGEQVVDEETLAWETLNQRADLNADQVSRFIAQYPNGRTIDQARKRLDGLRAASVVAASAAPASAAATATTGDAAQGTTAAATQAATSSVTAASASPTPADAPAAAPVEPAMVSVSVSIKPWGNVFVDGVDRGVSPPLKKLSLAEGKHSIKVVNPGFPEHVAEIEIVKKKSARITVDFTPTGK